MIPAANDASVDLARIAVSVHGPRDPIHWGRVWWLGAILSVLASAARPIPPPHPPASAQGESFSTPSITLRISFDDGTPPVCVRDVRFLRRIQPEWFLGRALTTSDVSVVVAARPSPKTRWVNVYACASFPEFSNPKSDLLGTLPLDALARYDCFLPFDPSDLTTNTVRRLVLPRGNASLRVVLLPPDGADEQIATAQLETVWQPGNSSMIMPGRPQADGSTLFAPVWPGIYYVSCTCNGARYRRPVAVQGGEHSDEGIWPWPEGRIRGQLVNPDGSPSSFTRLHLFLEKTDGFDLPTLGSVPLEAAFVETDGAGRFECASLLPGTYLPSVLSVHRWDHGEGPDRWPFATRERISIESVLTETRVRLSLKPEWIDDPRFPTSQAGRPPASFTYDPTNGTVCTAEVWTVKQ